MQIFTIKNPLFWFGLLLTLSNCSNPVDDWPNRPEESYPLCMMNSDGSDYQVIQNNITVSCMAIDNAKAQIMVLDGNEMKFFNYEGDITHEYDINLDGITDPVFSFNQKFLLCMASDKNSKNKDLYLIPTDGSDLRKLTDSPNVAERYPSFSHQGDKIVYTTLSVPDYKFSTIEIMELAGGDTTVMHSFENHLEPHVSYNPFWYPVFSFDDRKVLFYWQRRNNRTGLRYTEFHAIHVDNREMTLLDGSASFTGAIVTSAISDYALYMHLNSKSHLNLANSNGQFFWQPTLMDNYNTIYCFSPTENKFVYAKKARTNFSGDYVYLGDIEKKCLDKLRLGGHPVYSPDGKKILFVGYERIEHN